jgi:hypothetical protein
LTSTESAKKSKTLAIINKESISENAEKTWTVGEALDPTSLLFPESGPFHHKDSDHLSGHSRAQSLEPQFSVQEIRENNFLDPGFHDQRRGFSIAELPDLKDTYFYSKNTETKPRENAWRDPCLENSLMITDT